MEKLSKIRFGFDNYLQKFFIAVTTCMISTQAFAVTNLGSMASTIVSSFGSVTRLISGGAYIAGLGFSISAIMKFKQHKDNPTQISVGQPIALVFIAAALLFLPSILEVAGNTIFGTSAKTAGHAGFTSFTGGS